MLSKVFNISFRDFFRAQPAILSNSFRFCTSTGQRYESHPLRNKIMGLSSLDEFTNFFREKNQQFDPSCYSMASRTLAKILIESRLVLNFNHREALKVYLSSLQKVDIEAMNLQQFSQLLYLLRILKLDPINDNQFIRQYMRSILDRSEGKVKELQADNNINRLAYFYQEYSSLGARASVAIARKINQSLQNKNTQVESQPLTLNEINLILKGMRSKKHVSNEEIYLLRNIIRTVVQKYFDKLSFFELVQISVSVNEVNAANVNDTIPNHYRDLIHRKVLKNLDDMDQKSIMYILNGQKTNNRTYNQIYRILFDKILDQIQPNGESSFNQLFTLRLFNGISNKIKLQSATPQNQEKFFNFFKQAITKTPRFVHSFVETYIEGNFFNYKHLVRVLGFLESIPDFKYRLTMLHALAKKRINVEKIANFETDKDTEVKDRNLIMMIFITYSIVEQKNTVVDKSYAEFLVKLKERFFSLYKVEDDSFAKLIFSLSPELIESLNRSMRREIEAKYPNPIETEQPEKYRSAWFKFQIFGNSEQSFAKKTIIGLKEKATSADMSKILKIFLLKGSVTNDSISNILNLVLKRFDLIQKDEQLIVMVSRLMHHEIMSIFEGGSSQVIKNRFWHILNDSFEKLEPQVFFKYFSRLINHTIKSTSYSFVYSSQYQSFLLKILQKAQHIQNRDLATDLMEECLKLNLIKRADIANLSPNLLKNLMENQKLLLKMIESNDFALEGIQLSKNNLHLFLYNNSDKTIELLSKNREKLMSIIADMKVKDCWKSLVHYRLGAKKNAVEILEGLLKQLNKFKVRFEEFSPVFLLDVMKRNSLDKSYFRPESLKIVLSNALEFYTDRRNIGKMPLEDHLEFLRAANDFKFRSENYVHELLAWFSGQLNFFSRQLYMTAGNLGVTLNTKEMERLIEVNFFTGFNVSFSKSFSIFLLNEKDIPSPSERLKSIIAKYNELSAKQKVPIYQVYYEYLKKNYPEQTKDWQPNHIEKADFCRNLETINSRYINTLRQVTEEVTQTKWVENVVSSNYYYTFRNMAFIFPYDSKYFGANNLVKKMLSSLTGIEKFILVNRRQSSSKASLKFIVGSDDKLFTPAEEADITKKIEQKIADFKTAAGQEHPEQAAEEQQSHEQKTKK